MGSSGSRHPVTIIVISNEEKLQNMNRIRGDIARKNAELQQKEKRLMVEAKRAEASGLGKEIVNIHLNGIIRVREHIKRNHLLDARVVDVITSRTLYQDSYDHAGFMTSVTAELNGMTSTNTVRRVQYAATNMTDAHDTTQAHSTAMTGAVDSALEPTDNMSDEKMNAMMDEMLKQ